MDLGLNIKTNIFERNYAPLQDPPKEVEALVYRPIGIESEKLSAKVVSDWDIFQDFEIEMNELAETMIQAWISDSRTTFHDFLKTCLRIQYRPREMNDINQGRRRMTLKTGYSSKEGRTMHSKIFYHLVYLALEYWEEKFPVKFRTRIEVNFGIHDAEEEENIFSFEENDIMNSLNQVQEEEKTSEKKLKVFQRIRPQDNIVFSFGDLESSSKSIFTDLYSGFVIKFMDKDCLLQTQVKILCTYMKILSQAEHRNVYYGLLIDSDSRTFFKYSRDEGTLFHTKTFSVDLVDLYLEKNWNEDEERFFRLLAAMCLKFLKDLSGM